MSAQLKAALQSSPAPSWHTARGWLYKPSCFTEGRWRRKTPTISAILLSTCQLFYLILQRVLKVSHSLISFHPLFREGDFQLQHTAISCAVLPAQEHTNQFLKYQKRPNQGQQESNISVEIITMMESVRVWSLTATLLFTICNPTARTATKSFFKNKKEWRRVERSVHPCFSNYYTWKNLLWQLCSHHVLYL